MASTGQRARLPRFLPPDPRVEEPYLLTPKMALRVAILGGLALVVFGVLFLRLWSLQILSSSHYLAAAQNNQLRTVEIEAPRGPILDRQGRVLVTNVAGTAIDLWPVDLPRGTGRDTELRNLSAILHVPLKQIEAKIRAQRSDPLTPVTLKRGVHEDQVAYVYEHQSQFRGVRIRQTFLRYYNSQALLAQVLGYDGQISPQQYKRLRPQGYTANDTIGQAGVESSYDRYLRGQPGQGELRVDALGRPQSALQLKAQAQPGLAVRLTIDIALQRTAERALKYGIALAHKNGKWAADGGGAVALDPNTGEVLAMASNPTFKPSVYVGRLDPEKVAPLLDSRTAAKANYPGLNRAIQGVYPAGSTFKPVTALAALQEHLISPYQSLPCTGTFSVPNQFGGRPQIFKNWDPGINQAMTLPVALGYSCDTYFYRVGYEFFGLPSDRGHPLQAWASRLGFGGPTGVDLSPEANGLLPTPEWREATYTKQTDPCCWHVDRVWKPGDSIQLAIGQKDLLVTPLQMARFYAALANGGRLVTPHVVEDVEEPGANGAPPVVERRFDPPPAQPTGVDPSALQVVRDGLFMGTHASFGTSSGVFGAYKVPVCGKTGTAEKVVSLPSGYTGEQDQSWWVGYAPCDKPKLAVAVLIENGGHGGDAAAPAALKIFEQYFGVKAPATSSHLSD
ncbi:MAG: penicillin-binding protein 2 [Actinobacteria bacterium]|nr:MAG: penicillin-binding protein 2 [Actinomycetota bacterium]